MTETSSGTFTDLDFEADETTRPPSYLAADPAVLAATLCILEAVRGHPDLSGVVMLRSWTTTWNKPLEHAWEELENTRKSFPGLVADFVDWPIAETWLVLRYGTEERDRFRRNDSSQLLHIVTTSVRKGQPLCIILADTDEAPDAWVLAAVDMDLTLLPPTPEMVDAVAMGMTGTKPTVSLCRGTSEELTPEALRLAVRPGKPPDAYIWRLSKLMKDYKAKSAARAAVDSPLKLDSLHGMDEAVTWGQSLATDLRAYAAGNLTWNDVDRGVLLVGPPGVGKTTFAKALAASCDVPLIGSSYAQWQSAGRGYLGDLLKAMQSTFDEARKKAPCILFIDELDAFYMRAAGHNADWWGNVNGALLELMDGVLRRDGVVLVAATNHPEVVDNALKRAGRLDKSISISLPDQAALARILRVHLRDDLPGVDLLPLALTGLGGSGADAEKCVRGARRRARQAGTAMTVQQLASEILGDGGTPKPPAHHVLVHEAGHALMLALETPGALSFVSVRERGDSAGEVVSRADVSLTDDVIGQFIRRLLGGRAAEHVVFGEVTAGAGGTMGSDLAQATRFALYCETTFCFRRLVWLGAWDGMDVASTLLGNPGLAKRVDRRLSKEWRRTVAIIRANRPALEALVAAFEQRPVISGGEAEAIVAAAVGTGEGAYSRWVQRLRAAAGRLRPGRARGVEVVLR